MSLAGIGVAAGLVGCAAAQDRKPYAEDDKVAPRLALPPCSVRLPLIRALRLEPSESPEDALETALDAERFIGVEENVEILRGGVLRVRYPEDSVNFGSADDDDEVPLGGAAFYVPMGRSKVSCLHYRVRFPADFEFNKGGKLPGLYAGEAPSGGEEVSGKDGWSVRLMWREDGEGELYEYVFNKEDEYGLSAGRGAFTFPRGRWVDVDLEVVLNDPDQRNGKARLWIDGRAVIEQDDIVYRRDDGRPLEGGLMFSTFFGGSDDSWASPKDQHVDFADFRLYAGDGGG